MSEAVDRLIEKMELVYPLIKKIKTENKGKNWSGTMQRPVCKGELRMFHAMTNGHVMGKCKTDGCVNWME